MMTIRRIAVLSLLALLLHAGEHFIRIEYPNGGEVLKGGSQVAVQWHSLGVDGPVAILLFKAGEQHAVIANSAPNTGSFQWTVPANLPDSGQYRLRICSLGDLRINDFSDRDFAIKR
jgi:hypothetical protein